MKPSLKETEVSVKTESASPLVVMSEMDAYVNERVKSQPKSLEEIHIKSEREFPEGTSVLQLPKELEKYRKKYAFRWLNKKKRSLDRALDVIGWTLVHRVYFKDLPDHLFTANGVVERGDAILGFMPEKQAAEIRLRPSKLSREKVKNLPVQPLDKWQDRGENYYKPDYGSAASDSDSEYSKGNRGIVVQPDLKQIED